MSQTLSLRVAQEFSITPGARYEFEGKFPGEDFRDNHLYPKLVKAIESDKVLVVDLDGTAGYGTSFLEESFGGLIRERGLSLEEINSHMNLISKEEPYLIEDINEYLQEAAMEAVK